MPVETPATSTLVSCDGLGGLGYNVVPPPYTGNFMPPKPDFYGLEEFVNELKISEPTVMKSVVETSEAKASADKPKFVRKNFGSPLIKDWISDSGDEDESKPKIEMKTIKSSFAKIEFVKSKEQIKSPRNTTVKQVVDSFDPSMWYSAEIANPALVVFLGEWVMERLQGVSCRKSGEWVDLEMAGKVRMMNSMFDFGDRGEEFVLVYMSFGNGRKAPSELYMLLQNSSLLYTTLAVDSFGPSMWLESGLFYASRLLLILSFSILSFTCTRTWGGKWVMERLQGVSCRKSGEWVNLEMAGKVGMMNSMFDFRDRGEGIIRPYSVARTPQQNGVDERRNRTLIKAARTILLDSKLPTTFWAEAVNTACYVQKKVLVVKPHNKNPYELFHGRTPALSFMRPFGCLVTILNTKDHLGKFDGKADEGFFVGYSLNSKGFRVFNNRTRIVEENLHIRFSENIPNIVENGPNWLFDINALTKSINYKLVIAGNQSNDNAGTKACDDAGKARMETVPGKDYILLSLWTGDPLISQELKSLQDDGFQPSSDDGKKVDEDPRQETNDVGANSRNELPFDPELPELEDISTFTFSNEDEDDGAEADMNNLDTTIQVSPTPTTRIHKDHPIDQVIGDLYSTTQTRNMSKNLEEHRAIGTKWVFRNKKDERGIVIRNKARLVAQGHTQEEGIDNDEIFSLVARIKAIRLFLAYASFKDFVVYQMDVKSDFLYGKIEEEPLLKDEDGEEVDVHMYRSMIGSLMYLTSLRPNIMFAVCACARYQVNPKVSHLHGVKRIFRYLKGQPKFGLWYLKDSSFDLVAYTDSDYARASLDRKSTIGGCQFLVCRLISWQCKKQTVVVNFTTEAEYVAASSYCGQSNRRLVTTQEHALKMSWARSNQRSYYIQIFYHGLDEPTQGILDVTARGIFLYKSPNQAFQLLEDKVLFKHDWSTKSKIEHHQESISFADGSDSNTDNSRFMKKLEALKVDSQFQSLNEEIQEMCKNYNNCKGYLNQNYHDSYPHQSYHDPNDSEKSLTELNNDVRNDLEDFKRCIHSMRTVHWKLFARDNGKTTGVLPKKKSKAINQEPQFKTDPENQSPNSWITKEFQIWFEQTVDFLNASPIKYALTVNPTVYTSCIEQFWATIKAKTVNGEGQLRALVDGKKTKRKDTELPQTSVPTSVADETVNEEMNDSLEKAATTATSLDAEQDKYNIYETQSKVTHNEAGSQGTSSGGGPRFQEAMGDAVAQTRSERVSKVSNDPLLAGVNTPRSGGDSLKLNELMELCTNLQNMVLDLETIKTTQAMEIKSLKRKVKKLEKKQRVKHAKPKPKAKGIVFHEPEEFTTTTTAAIPKPKSQDNAKFENEQRFASERAQQEQEANIALIESWDDVQAKIDAEYQLDERLQAKEKKSCAKIQELFGKAIKKLNTFIDFKTELVEKSSKKAEVEITQEGSSKRARDELKQKRCKKQKVEDDKESEELKKCLKIISDDGDDVTIDATPLSSKSPTIIDYKIYQERKKSYFQIFRADGCGELEGSEEDNDVVFDNTVCLSHMFYVDDVVFVGKWGVENINTLTNVLDCFHCASGLKINMSKSKIMGVNVDGNKVTRAASKLGCLSLSSPFSYLGTKVGDFMSCEKAWKEVVDKVKNRLTKWKMKSLSIGGRLTLLKSVLGSIPIYHIKKASWVKWEKVLAAKDKGGLGVASLFALNRGLLVKWVWRFYKHETSLWKKNLGSSGDFSVASIRRKIDDSRLSTVGDKTRWVKFVPIKINVFAWKVMVNALPTCFNLSRRGIDIQSISCPMCDCGTESMDHVFAICDLTRNLGRLISNWWNTPFEEVDSIAAWKSWFSSIRLAPNLKLIFEGVWAFQVTADVPEIYMQEFWATAKLHHTSIRFKMDTKKSILELETFREMLHISPRIPSQSFAELPTEEEILKFLSDQQVPDGKKLWRRQLQIISSTNPMGTLSQKKC
nr:putative ribonuclease H-like domain-containing protein [Tanacetum cinerariifolium]